MVLASGNAWKEAIKKFKFTEDDLTRMAQWIVRRYFREEDAKKPWYKPGVTEETALMELLEPSFPLTPLQASDMWRLLPVIGAGLGKDDLDEELEAVRVYLGRDKLAVNIPKYNKGDSTLAEMAEELGDITPTMVNKVFINGARKLRELTGGVSPEDMNERDLESLLIRIDETREEAAIEFASALKACNGDIQAFLDGQLKAHHLSKTERISVTRDEIQFLGILSTLDIFEIENALLADLEEEDNLFRTFQNAASKKLFPNRAGRPKGSKAKAALPPEEADEDEEVIQVDVPQVA